LYKRSNFNFGGVIGVLGLGPGIDWFMLWDLEEWINVEENRVFSF
jgi:hypothetical protein